MAILDNLQNLDRRIIFLFIGLAVIVPLIFNLTFPEHPTPIVTAIFDFVESLPEGSVVLMPFDYDPSTAPELDPMATALMRHCLTRNLKVCTIALWPEGQGMANNIFTNVVEPEFPEKVYGVDYVNLGYKAGAQGLINTILLNMRSMYTADTRGTPVDDLPLMKKILTLRDFDLIMNFSAGKPGTKEWVQFAGDPGDIPIASGSTAVQAPLLYPYYPSQMVGMMGGLKGAAEYETALVEAYPQFEEQTSIATQLMAPQAVAHFVIIIFVIIGNVIYFTERKKKLL
jgi:hypothetical protein